MELYAKFLIQSLYLDIKKETKVSIDESIDESLYESDLF